MAGCEGGNHSAISAGCLEVAGTRALRFPKSVKLRGWHMILTASALG